MNKRISALIIILIVAIAGLFALQKYQKNKVSKLNPVVKFNPTFTSSTPVAVKESSQTVLSILPKDFPVEVGAQFTDSLSYKTATSSVEQFTLSYFSQKTLAENEKIFSGYLSSQGYTMISKIELNSFASYSSIKDRNNLMVTIQKLKDNKVKVTINVFKKIK